MKIANSTHKRTLLSTSLLMLPLAMSLSAQVLTQGALQADSAVQNNSLVASSSLLSLPDAPEPVQSTIPSGPQTPATTGTYVQCKQTKRILGIVPNFRAVSADVKLPPQTVKEKFQSDFQDSFDYSAFIFAGIQAGVAQAQNSYPPFHQGAAGYARYYWHTFADQTDENLWVEFMIPAVLHQDPRYYTLSHGNVLKRAAYSFSRVAITRKDSGGETPNISEVLGAGVSSAISSAYYPSQDRTWTKTGQRWLTSVIIDGATFTFKEFWPDINDRLFHQKD